MSIFKRKNKGGVIKPAEEWVWIEGFSYADKNMNYCNEKIELNKQYDLYINVFTKLEHMVSNEVIRNGNRYFKIKALVTKNAAERISSWCTHSLNAKSFIFTEEISREDVFKAFALNFNHFFEINLMDMPDEYKNIMFEKSVHTAVKKYSKSILIEDGYSELFADYIVKNKKFEIAHALASQTDVSMDAKAMCIAGVKETSSLRFCCSCSLNNL